MFNPRTIGVLLKIYIFYHLECITVHPQLPLVASGQAAGTDEQEVDGSHVQVNIY